MSSVVTNPRIAPLGGNNPPPAIGMAIILCSALWVCWTSPSNSCTCVLPDSLGHEQVAEQTMSGADVGLAVGADAAEAGVHDAASVGRADRVHRRALARSNLDAIESWRASVIPHVDGLAVGRPAIYDVLCAQLGKLTAPFAGYRNRGYDLTLHGVDLSGVAVP